MRDRATATITTLIVDDESLASEELAYLLKDFPEVEVVATGGNGLEAVDLIQKLEPDLVFLDAQDVIYATIDSGLITVVATNIEGQSNYRTLEDLQANLDRDTFWRVHRSYLVNINRIREVVPWFKSSYQLRMDDKKSTEIPVSRVQTRRLRELLKL